MQTPPSSGPLVLTFHQKSILKTAIVDDEIELGELYSRALVRFGYSSPSLFTDGNSLVDSIMREGEAFDILIIDFQMPGINGIEASKIVLQHTPCADHASACERVNATTPAFETP